MGAAALLGRYEQVSDLNAVNMLGYSENRFNETLGRNIWGGEIQATYGELDAELGYYDLSKPGEITLSSGLVGPGKDKAAKLAAVMAHEGTHAYGNRYESVAHQQGSVTYASLVSTFGLEGDAAFTNGMIAALMDPASYVENTGDRDNWKLVRKGSGWGWEDDRSLDFDISVLSAEKQALLKEALSLGGRGLTAEGKIRSEDMSAGIIAVFTNELYENPEASDGRALVFSPETTRHSFDTMAFATGTRRFVEASAYGKTLMGYLEKEGAYGEATIQQGLNKFNSGLYAVRRSGLLVEHEMAIDTTGLIGEGTDANPYVAARGLAEGTVSVTGWGGYRYVNEGFYYGLYNSMVATGERDQAWLDRNYPLRGFAANVHSGGDLVGSGDVVAQVTGTLRMGYDRVYGLSGFTVSGANPNTGYFSGHMGAESVMDYLALVATRGTTLESIGGSYSVTGVIAGMILGEQGSTGIATADHVHNEIRLLQSDGTWKSSFETWKRVFQTNSVYSAGLRPTTWAARYTGYDTNNLYDPLLWKNIYDGWRWNGYGYSNFPAFQFDHLDLAPSSFGLY